MERISRLVSSAVVGERAHNVRRCFWMSKAKVWGSWPWIVRAVKMRASAMRARERIDGRVGGAGLCD